jgi:phage-related protein
MLAIIQYRMSLPACYPKIQTLKYIELYNFSCCSVWVKNLVFHTERGTKAEDVQKQGTEEDTWASEGRNNRSGEDYITRSFMICTPHQILFR